MNRILISIVLALAGGCANVELPEADIGRGGVSFDYAAITQARFKGAFDPGRNLLKDPPAPGHISASKSFTFAVPHTNGGVWRVSCRYKMRHEKAGSAKFSVSPGGYWSYLIPENGSEWGVLSETAKVPAGSDKIKVSFQLNGGSVRLDYRDFTLVDETPKTPVVGQWTQADLLDGTFAVPSGQVAFLEFTWRKTGEKDYPPERFKARLELPPGIEYVDSTYANRKTVKTVRNSDGSSVTTFRVGSGACKPGREFVRWAFNTTVVRGVSNGLGERGVGRLTLDYDNSEEGFSVALNPVRFQVIPAIKADAPVEYANGIMPTEDFSKMSESVRREVSGFFGACGVSWIVKRDSADMYELWRKSGVKYITPGIWPCTDGYHICSGSVPVPESDRYVALDKDLKPTKVMSGSVCPVTVYEESDYFRNATVPFVRNYLKGADGCWSNWEPGSYAGKGCFCDRCCRKFSDYVKKPYEEIKADWPKCVMKDGAFYGKIQKFRSLEHAKVVKTMDRVVRDCTGGDKSHGLIPGIAWIEMSSWWRPRNYAAEVQAIDYAGALKWMCPWGPYAAWETAYPYVDARRKPLCQFLAAKDVRRTVDADYPADSRPKLMALPQGMQCLHWLTQPENIGMALDSNFFNGFESTVEYYFPQGYDARYWERFADATGRAAKYERIVSTGVRVDADVTVQTDDSYAPLVRWPSAYLPNERDVSLLQTVAWRKDGRLVVAVFNFWENGEAFFTLKAGGLAGKVAVVDEEGVLRVANRASALYDGAALATTGVRLVVPAARCRVFEFRMDGDWADATSVLTDEGFRRLYKQRRDALKRAADAEARREEANGPLDTDPMPVI